MNWTSKRWALSLACIVVLTFIVILGRTDIGKASPKTSWEYKVVNTNSQRSTGMEDPERGLNQLGMDGWELVHYIRDDGPIASGMWIFKRPK